MLTAKNRISFEDGRQREKNGVSPTLKRNNDMEFNDKRK